MIRLFYIYVLVVSLFALCSCDTSMHKYAPVNDNEKDIIEILTTYLEARNSNDVNKLATLFADDGEYIGGDGNIIKGKDGVANSDPGWWTYYGKQKLFNLEIDVEKSKAIVSTTAKWGAATKYPQKFYLIKDNEKWIFSKIEVVR